jgi:ADP-heptose:LPS heptosyltransferase
MRILLSRTDRIGDLILSTPAIATVRASFPDAWVTMVTSDYNSVVMQRNDDVDELIVWSKEIKPRAFGSKLRGYDLAIALAPRAVDLQLVGGTQARMRIGYTYERRWFARLTAKLYLDRVMISEADPELSDREPHRHVRHEVVQLLDLVALAGAQQRVMGLAQRPNRASPRATLVCKGQHAGKHAGDGQAVDRVGAGRDHLRA